MAKYGRGLNIEFVCAVKAGEVQVPFNTEDVREFAKRKSWKPSEKYISILLQMDQQNHIALHIRNYSFQ